MELSVELWNGPISYDDAEYEINQDGSYLGQKDGLWGLYDNDDPDHPIVDYEYESKEELIQWYFDDMGWCLDDHRQEIFEHWIVSSYLAKKLKEQGETVIEDFYGINYIWCRSTTGQAIYADAVIEAIYNELVNQ
jgi:hypothetical protein